MLTAVPPAQPGLPAFSKRRACRRPAKAWQRRGSSERKLGAQRPPLKLACALHGRSSWSVGACASAERRLLRWRLTDGHRQEHLDATDLGQGRKMAGGPSFQRTRRSLWRRVVELFPELPDAVRVQEERAWRLWDEAGARRLGSAWGHIYRDEMVKLEARRRGATKTLS